MTLQEAFVELEKELNGNTDVVALGVGKNELIVYALRKFTVPDKIDIWPVRLVVTGKIRPM